MPILNGNLAKSIGSLCLAWISAFTLGCDSTQISYTAASVIGLISDTTVNVIRDKSKPIIIKALMKPISPGLGPVD